MDNLDTEAARRSIENAQNSGAWPTIRKEVTSTPQPETPTAKPTDYEPPLRSHEESMEFFHKALDEYRKILREEQLQKEERPHDRVARFVIPPKKGFLQKLSEWFGNLSGTKVAGTPKPDSVNNLKPPTLYS